MPATPFDGALVLLALAVLAVALFRRAHLPPVLGYLLVGICAGPNALGWLPQGAALEHLAEVGVVFLLFLIGLEFSLPHLLSMRRAVLGLGGSQVALSTLLFGGIALAFGLSWEGALVVGGALAMSSTALALRQLAEQLETHSRHGRLATAVLLFQDLAVVPLLVLIPILAGEAGHGLGTALLLALAKAVLALAAVYALGHYVLRPLFHTVAAARSAELFTLTALLVSLTAAWVTTQLGLSAALGAFLAGMMLGETEYRHQVEASVRPFQDVLMGIFFVTVGARLDPAALPAVAAEVLLLVMLLTAGKALIIYLLTRGAGHDGGVALRTAMVLAQGGEFAFALLALAVGRGIVGQQDLNSLLAGLVISMALAPVLIRYNGRAAKRLFPDTYLRGRQEHQQALQVASRELAAHVVICGFGRIGQNLAGFLREEGIAYMALDLDPRLVREAWEAGEPVHYGDSTHPEILAAAGLDRARALVVTFDDAHTAARILRAARRLRGDLPVVVRTHDDRHLEELERAGASVVVPEAVESSMLLATHLLRVLQVPVREIVTLVEEARRDHYRRLRGLFHGEEPAAESPDPFCLHTVVLPPAAHAVGRTVGELRLGEGVSLHAVRRGEVRGEQPELDMRLREGDALVLQGPRETLAHAEERILRG